MGSPWLPDEFPAALPSFREPVAMPGVEPDVGPCRCVSINADWLGLVVGSVDQLLNAATWNSEDSAALALTLARVARLKQMIGTSQGCSQAPPAPPVMSGDDIDCKIASYLVRTVVKEALQAAINKVFAVPEALGFLEHLADFIPGVGDFLGLVGFSSKNAAAYIGANVGLDWVETQAEDTVWDAIGCSVYSGVQGVHRITDATLGPIRAAIEGLGIGFPDFLTAVSGILGDIGADALTGIAELATITDFDCSACGGSPPVITGTDPQVVAARALTVTDGTDYVHHVGAIEFEGATVGGDSELAIVSGLQGPQGVKGDTGAAGAAGVKGDTGAAGAAGAKGDTGAAGAKGDTGDAGATGPQGPAAPAGLIATASPGDYVDLVQAAWTTVATLLPPAGTYLVRGVVDIASGTTPDVPGVRILAGATELCGAEALVITGGSVSIPTPDVVCTLDGATLVYLQAYVTTLGCQALLITDQQGVGPATVLSVLAPGSGPAGPAGTQGPQGEPGTGNILGYCYYRRATDSSWSFAGTVDQDIDATNLAVTFVAPASGSVIVRVGTHASINSTAHILYLDLRESGVAVSGTEILPESVLLTASYHVFIVAGLAAGSHTFTLGGSGDSAGAVGYLWSGPSYGAVSIVVEGIA